LTVACLRALRVAFEDAENLELSDDIFQILERSLEVEDLSVRREVVHAYLDFDKFNPEICEKRLLEIAQKGDSLVRFTIVDRLWFLDLKDRSKEVTILKFCSMDDDLNVLGGIARILSRKGKTFINDSLQILYGWLKRSKYHDIPALDYSLHELGKNILPHCLKTVERWIEFEDDPVFLLQVSRLLRNLASSNYDELLNNFEAWIVNKGLKFKKVIIETLVDILILGNPSENIIDRSFNIMKLLKERELQSTLESSLVQLFGMRPSFVKSEKIIQILDEWVSSPDWILRRSIIPALYVVAEYKIDSEETLHMLINRETKETKVAGISSKMIETPEGVKAYEFLEGLTNDENDAVKNLAVGALKDVNRRLKEKEERITERYIEDIEGIQAYIFFPPGTIRENKTLEYHEKHKLHYKLIVNLKLTPHEAYYMSAPKSFGWRFVKKYGHWVSEKGPASLEDSDFTRKWCEKRRWKLNPYDATKKDLLRCK